MVEEITPQQARMRLENFQFQPYHWVETLKAQRKTACHFCGTGIPGSHDHMAVGYTGFRGKYSYLRTCEDCRKRLLPSIRRALRRQLDEALSWTFGNKMGRPVKVQEIPSGALEFFRCEIRNERDGGVSPATFSSALDSLQQWPRRDWEARFGDMDELRAYLEESIRESGADGQLQYVLGV